MYQDEITNDYSAPLRTSQMFWSVVGRECSLWNLVLSESSCRRLGMGREACEGNDERHRHQWCQGSCISNAGGPGEIDRSWGHHRSSTKLWRSKSHMHSNAFDSLRRVRHPTSLDPQILALFLQILVSAFSFETGKHDPEGASWGAPPRQQHSEEGRGNPAWTSEGTADESPPREPRAPSSEATSGTVPAADTDARGEWLKLSIRLSSQRSGWYRIPEPLCPSADQQLQFVNASEAGPAWQLNARAVSPWCLLRRSVRSVASAQTPRFCADMGGFQGLALEGFNSKWLDSGVSCFLVQCGGDSQIRSGLVDCARERYYSFIQADFQWNKWWLWPHILTIIKFQESPIFLCNGDGYCFQLWNPSTHLRL